MLNAHYVALRVIGARRAFSLLCKHNDRDRPVAEIVSVEDGNYVSYNFEDWAELSEFRREFEPEAHDWVRTVRTHHGVVYFVDYHQCADGIGRGVFADQSESGTGSRG